MEKVRVKKLDDNVWNFNEAGGRDAYLITGTKRAAVIDALWDENDLLDCVRSLTSLPFDVLITHGHRDHAGSALKDFHAAGYDLYMNEKDFFLLQDDMEPGWFKALEGGMVFDLGGRRLETIALPGHTPGQMFFLERESQLLFPGDGTGAGVFWMQLPGCLPLRELQKNFAGLWETVKDMDKLKIHPGHRHQAPVQLGLEFFADTILATNKIISGEWTGEDRDQDFHGTKIHSKSVAYKLITDYRYLPDNIE